MCGFIRSYCSIIIFHVKTLNVNNIFSNKVAKKLLTSLLLMLVLVYPSGLAVSDESQIKSNAFDGLKPGEHPLRMDTWKLNIKPYRPFRHPSARNIFNEIGNEQILVFDEKYGRVEWIRENDKSHINLNDTQVFNSDEIMTNPYISYHVTPKKRRRGRWQLKHGYVIWHLPLRDCTTGIMNHDTILHYRAIIHLQKFSERPRMFRGVISRDRFSCSWLPKEWFRPIVATFVASGDSEDTLDLEYRQRERVFEAAVRQAEASRQRK